MILRTFVCDHCGEREEEKAFGKGVIGWGQLTGAAWNNIPDPLFCPKCMEIIKINIEAGF